MRPFCCVGYIFVALKTLPSSKLVLLNQKDDNIVVCHGQRREALGCIIEITIYRKKKSLKQQINEEIKSRKYILIST